MSLTFRSFAEGEIHGLGLDEDSNTQTGKPRAFKVYGTQKNWNGMNQDYDNYNGSGEYAHYTIPVGTYFTGQMNHIFFFNDNDLPKACNDVPANDQTTDKQMIKINQNKTIILIQIIIHQMILEMMLALVA